MTWPIYISIWYHSLCIEIVQVLESLHTCKLRACIGYTLNTMAVDNTRILTSVVTWCWPSLSRIILCHMLIRAEHSAAETGIFLGNWLLILWLRMLQGPHMTMKINRCLPFMRKNFNYLCYLSAHTNLPTRTSCSTGFFIHCFHKGVL